MEYFFSYILLVLTFSEEMCDAKEQQNTLWIYLYRCSKLGPRSIWRKQEVCLLEEQSRTVCDKAIRHRMERVCIDHSPIKSPNIRAKPSAEALACIYDIMDVLVASNPELYTDVSFKMNMNIHDERAVCRAYSDFAESLFQKGVTWPLITALFAFSGSLAAECTRNGRSILVRSICDWATVFIVMRLKEWLKENSGWEGVVSYFGERSFSAGQCASSIIKSGRAQIRRASLMLVKEDYKKEILEKCVSGVKLNNELFQKGIFSFKIIQTLFLFVALLFLVVCITSANINRTIFNPSHNEVGANSVRCEKYLS